MISKNIFIGLAAGSLICLAVPVILKYKKEQKLFSDEDLTDEGEEFRKLDEVNDYLLATKRKVNEMVKDAELRSSSMLQDAAAILSRAKEKLSRYIVKMKMQLMISTKFMMKLTRASKNLIKDFVMNKRQCNR